MTQQNAEKAETISGLNSQVDELTAENTEKAQTITRQNTTIVNLNAQVGERGQIINQKDGVISGLNSQISTLTDDNASLVSQHESDLNTIAGLNSQINRTRFYNIDLTLDSLEIFDTLPSNTPVSGEVYINGCILSADKQRIEAKFPELSVNAEYIVDFANYMLDLTGKLVVDSDDNVLSFSQGGEHHSIYTAADIDNFIDAINKQIGNL